MNYMDYVNDQCMFLFSEGQATRMRAAIEGARSGLLSSGGITAISLNRTLEETSIYPNPSISGKFSVQLNGKIESLRLNDSYGRFVIEKSVNSDSYELDLSEYSNGIYYLEIRSNGISTTKKIVIQ